MIFKYSFGDIKVIDISFVNFYWMNLITCFTKDILLLNQYPYTIAFVMFIIIYLLVIESSLYIHTTILVKSFTWLKKNSYFKSKAQYMDNINYLHTRNRYDKVILPCNHFIRKLLTITSRPTGRHFFAIFWNI